MTTNPGLNSFGFCLTRGNVRENSQLLNRKTEDLSCNCVGVSPLRHLVVIMAVMNPWVEMWVRNKNSL